MYKKQDRNRKTKCSNYTNIKFKGFRIRGCKEEITSL